MYTKCMLLLVITSLGKGTERVCIQRKKCANIERLGLCVVIFSNQLVFCF